MENFSFKLSHFEGPLDLLLHLIQKAKIDLQDIFVSEITEQYLNYMERINDIDMERASAFLNMAATLIYIKSRSLLPVKRDEGEDDIDPETELINRLRAYQLYKDASLQLSQMEKSAANVFYKLPEEFLEGEQEFEIIDASANALYEAFFNLVKGHKEKEEYSGRKVEIRTDTFSIRKQKRKIVHILKQHNSMSFFSLFDEDASSMEIAVTFVALLELWHINQILVRQKTSFKDIVLTYNAGVEPS